MRPFDDELGSVQIDVGDYNYCSNIRQEVNDRDGPSTSMISMSIRFGIS